MQERLREKTGTVSLRLRLGKLALTGPSEEADSSWYENDSPEGGYAERHHGPDDAVGRGERGARRARGTYLKKRESKVDPREKVRRVRDPRGTARASAKCAKGTLHESTHK